MEIRNLQSLLVCPIIIWKSSLTRVEWISADGPDCPRIQSCVWCLAFTHYMRWCMFWHIRNPRIGLLRIRWWTRRRWICKKTFPNIPCVSQMLGGLSLRLGIPRERLCIPPGSRKGGKNEGWLVTWDCPLRTDSASWKSLESFIQLTSFCSSWILAVSSRIVSRSSINLLLENSSNVDHWKPLQFFHLIETLIWASRRSRFCSVIDDEDVVDLVEVVPLLQEHD